MQPRAPSVVPGKRQQRCVCFPACDLDRGTTLAHLQQVLGELEVEGAASGPTQGLDRMLFFELGAAEPQLETHG